MHAMNVTPSLARLCALLLPPQLTIMTFPFWNFWYEPFSFFRCGCHLTWCVCTCLAMWLNEHAHANPGMRRPSLNLSLLMRPAPPPACLSHDARRLNFPVQLENVTQVYPPDEQLYMELVTVVVTTQVGTISAAAAVLRAFFRKVLVGQEGTGSCHRPADGCLPHGAHKLLDASISSAGPPTALCIQSPVLCYALSAKVPPTACLLACSMTLLLCPCPGAWCSRALRSQASTVSSAAVLLHVAPSSGACKRFQAGAQLHTNQESTDSTHFCTAWRRH